MAFKEIEKDGIITLTHYAQHSKVNESYQTPSRVQSYVVTQDYVVPKKEFYENIIDVLIAKFSPNTKLLRILEPGMGPAAFSSVCVNTQFLKYFDNVLLHGADISRSMTEYACEIINQAYQKDNISDGRLEVSFSSGVNCIDTHAPFYQDIHEKNLKFEAIVASQFEHYCPNDSNSPLASKLSKNEIQYATKREFREFCFDLLVEGGVYFSIDDQLGKTAEEHQEFCAAWDKHIVSQFTDDTIIDHISKLNSALGRNLRITYDQTREEQDLLHVAAQAREHRRNISCEEIETLDDTRRDFFEIFGEENVYFMAHPNTETHPGFYLIWGVKQGS